MSWKTAGKLISGPPIASGSSLGSNSARPNDPRFKQNTGGLSAYQREQQFAAHYGRNDSREVEMEGRTDWDVLKENHRFIREDEDSGEVTWEERLARAYESKLFKEFALIDLKHYKSRRLALRWRTAEEVVEGLGEDTCASLRCKYHRTPSSSVVQIDPQPQHAKEDRKRVKRIPKLRAFELPFVYMEMGERREALVKVRLCGRCEGKLTWKPDREQSSADRRGVSEDEDDEDENEASEGERATRKESRFRRDEEDKKGERLRVRSRSRSPNRESRSRSRSPRRDRRLV